MTTDTDRTLIARAQQGDVAAFEALISEHLPQVRRFARAFARDISESDDLAQEALLKVYRSIRGYRFQAAFSTWLFAVVRNAFLDAVKSRAHRDRALEDSFDAKLHERAHTSGDDGLSADQRMVQEEERRRVWAAIEQIPHEFKTALVLFEVEGLSHDEIAAIEKVAVGTVKSRLSRARDHLKRILLTSGPDDAKGQAGENAAASSGNAGRPAVV